MDPQGERTSQILRRALISLENDIRLFIQENHFYLPFEIKSWAASPVGQKLIVMTTSAINLAYTIEDLEKLGL
jgi:hypothetical protein